MRFKYLLLPAIFLFAGCSISSPTPNNTTGICKTEPNWVLNMPVKEGVFYGVGIAPMNFNGAQAQRKSAIAKALNEIASQMQTTISSQTITTANTNKNSMSSSGSTSMNSVSFQTVNGQKVQAEIIKSCKNPNNGYLYILMKTTK
jgi:hypothetical protein